MNAPALETEQDLLARLRGGDEAAFDQLVRAQTGRMLAVARNILHHEEDAADAVQDAFLQAFRGLARFQGGSTLGTWLHRIVVNAALMRRRSQSRRSAGSLDALLPQFDDSGHHAQSVSSWSPTAFDRLVSEESRGQLRGCLAELPDDYREIIELRDLQELDTEEVARVLQITAGAVKTRLHRARQALRTLLDRLLP